MVVDHYELLVKISVYLNNCITMLQLNVVIICIIQIISVIKRSIFIEISNVFFSKFFAFYIINDLFVIYISKTNIHILIKALKTNHNTQKDWISEFFVFLLRYIIFPMLLSNLLVVSALHCTLYKLQASFSSISVYERVVQKI